MSGTLTQDDLYWSNSTLIPSDDAIGVVGNLREKVGGDLIVMGSPTLVRSLVENDLVDEHLLMIEPIVLGGGKRLFPDDGQSRPLDLVSTTTSSTGVLICKYRPRTS